MIMNELSLRLQRYYNLADTAKGTLSRVHSNPIHFTSRKTRTNSEFYANSKYEANSATCPPSQEKEKMTGEMPFED